MGLAELAKVRTAREILSSGGFQALREIRRLSQAELAAAISDECGHEVTATTLSRWERGLVRPGPEQALAVFAALEVLTAGGSL